MPAQLRVRDDLCIDDIARLSRDNVVKVTPHVGNWTPARLTLPTLGVSILCVDHTIGEKDVNAHPHMLIRAGMAHTLTQKSSILTTHARVTERTSFDSCTLGSSLSDVHVGTIRSLFPKSDIVTHTEHMRRTRETLLIVLEEVTKLSCSATWWRYVDGDGSVTSYARKHLPKRWEEYAERIFPVTNDREGWLVHNRVSILMDLIEQSQMGKRSDMYHLSGPDMVRYLDAEMPMISRMYDHVRKRLGFPEESITFNLIPYASFRFATRASQSDACTKLVDALVDTTCSESSVRSLLEEAFDIFSETETQSYFTQHDSVLSGESIIIPDQVRSWSMADCAAHLGRLRALL